MLIGPSHGRGAVLRSGEDQRPARAHLSARGYRGGGRRPGAGDDAGEEQEGSRVSLSAAAREDLHRRMLEPAVWICEAAAPTRPVLHAGGLRDLGMCTNEESVAPLRGMQASSYLGRIEGSLLGLLDGLPPRSEDGREPEKEEGGAIYGPSSPETLPGTPPRPLARAALSTNYFTLLGWSICSEVRGFLLERCRHGFRGLRAEFYCRGPKHFAVVICI